MEFMTLNLYRQDKGARLQVQGPAKVACHVVLHSIVCQSLSVRDDILSFLSPQCHS